MKNGLLVLNSFLFSISAPSCPNYLANPELQFLSSQPQELVKSSELFIYDLAPNQLKKRQTLWTEKPSKKWDSMCFLRTWIIKSWLVWLWSSCSFCILFSFVTYSRKLKFGKSYFITGRSTRLSSVMYITRKSH